MEKKRKEVTIMMSDEALIAFRRDVMDQTELVWLTQETVLNLLDEIIRLRKNAPDALKKPNRIPWWGNNLPTPHC